MKSVILCEGSTDLTLIQYYLEKTAQWKYINNTSSLGAEFRLEKHLKREQDILGIGATGSCSKIIPCLREVVDTVKFASNPAEGFDKIVIIADRDEVGSEDDFIRKLEELFEEEGLECSGIIENNKWLSISCENGRKQRVIVGLLLLLIPFDGQGALETFLLNAIADSDVYDKQIIEDCTLFVEAVDLERRYLKKRRYITKAKFDVYFSIRTALEQFQERRNILRSVPWEDYLLVQECFSKLEELHV